jgi:hypothetical protein
MAPIFPAGVRASAYAHVVNATAVGKTPGYTMPSAAVQGTPASRDASWPAKGRQAAAPAAQPNVVTCSADA